MAAWWLAGGWPAGRPAGQAVAWAAGSLDAPPFAEGEGLGGTGDRFSGNMRAGSSMSR